jgi:tRNA A22 N-methylase
MTNPLDRPPVLHPRAKEIVDSFRDIYDVCLDHGSVLARKHTDNERAFNALAPEVGRDLFASVMRQMAMEIKDAVSGMGGRSGV